MKNNTFYGITFPSEFQLSVENQRRLAFLLLASPTTSPKDAKNIIANHKLISKVNLMIESLQLELFSVTNVENEDVMDESNKEILKKISQKVSEWSEMFSMPTEEELIAVCTELNIPKSEFDSALRKLRATKLNTSAEISSFLSEAIICQEEAVSVMAMCIESYKLRFGSNDIPQVSPMFVGPTGTGKSALIEHTSELLGIPKVTINLASTVPTGYVGNGISKLLRDAFKQTESEKYIIHLEELDKTATHYHKNDDYKPSQQNELLQIFDGEIKLFKGSEQYDSEKSFSIYTKDCLIVASGAFDGIEDIIYKRILREFNGNRQLIDNQAILSYSTALDFQNYGIIPEIISRLSFISFFKKLDVNAIYHIMTESCNSELKKNINWLHKRGVDIKITDDAIWTVAQHVYNLNIGARAISTFITQIFEQIILYPDKYRKFVVNEEYVNYIFIKRKYRQLFNQFQTQKPDLLSIADSLKVNIDFVLDNYFLYKQFNH